MEVFVDGEVQILKDGAEEEFRKIYGPVWREDLLNWKLALLLKKGLITYLENDRDERKKAMRAIENTMKILGITWRDVEELFSEK
ncbi:MAG: hypothetical protein QXQ37_07055 [Nitrososphaerota archaeon]